MRQSQSDESGYETTSRHNRLVRCCSIYDNYNSIDNFILEEDEHSEDEENSVVLYIEDEDTIENDIQGMGSSLNCFIIADGGRLFSAKRIQLTTD